MHSSNPESHGQTQDVEPAEDLRHNDTSTRTNDPNTNIETAYEPMQQTQSRLSDNHLTIEINNPTTEFIPQNEPSHSRGGIHNLFPNSNPN